MIVCFCPIRKDSVFLVYVPKYCNWQFMGSLYRLHSTRRREMAPNAILRRDDIMEFINQMRGCMRLQPAGRCVACRQSGDDALIQYTRYRSNKLCCNNHAYSGSPARRAIRAGSTSRRVRITISPLHPLSTSIRWLRPAGAGPHVGLDIRRPQRLRRSWAHTPRGRCMLVQVALPR